MPVLVDSNVLIDIVTDDPKWYNWSSSMLAKFLDEDIVIINPIIYAEISIAFQTPSEVDKCFPPHLFIREALPWEAAFAAGKAFLAYRRQKGQKKTPLPDFYIGAHAKVCKYVLLTRDSTRYRTYFPKIRLVSP